MTPLRQRMLQDMRIRNLAVNTQQAYVQQISAFVRHFDSSPEVLGPEEVVRFLACVASTKHRAILAVE